MAVKPSKSGARAARSASGLSIVVPLFNEAKGLADLHARIVEVARRLKAERGLALEIVYVDDGSRDGTISIAK
jgi:glycosyltransferase involved in cell wall biosynthesis